MKKLVKSSPAQRIGWVLVLLLIWQLIVRSGKVSPLLLPGIDKVAAALLHALVNGKLAAQIGYSLAVISAGMLIAALLALLLAAGALRSRLLESLANTLCMFAHPLPAIALLPIIIIWFGVGTPAITAVIIHSVLWPLLLNLLAGFRAVPVIYIETGRSLSMNPLRLLCSVYLPASASFILSGVKIGWARAWRALISAEMIFGAVGTSGGVGWFLFESRVFMNSPALYAGIAVIICIGVVVEELLVLAERKTIGLWGMA